MAAVEQGLDAQQRQEREQRKAQLIVDEGLRTLPLCLVDGDRRVETSAEGTKCQLPLTDLINTVRAGDPSHGLSHNRVHSGFPLRLPHARPPCGRRTGKEQGTT
jgi:hypothetical protein